MTLRFNTSPQTFEEVRDSTSLASDLMMVDLHLSGFLISLLKTMNCKSLMKIIVLENIHYLNNRPVGYF